MPHLNGLFKNIGFNTKMVTQVENEIPNVSSLVRKINFDPKITEF